MQRQQIDQKNTDEAVMEFIHMLNFRLEEKGHGTFASRHEILGIAEAEMRELNEAVEHKNIEEVKHELLDVAVACVFGVACINQKSLDW